MTKERVFKTLRGRLELTDIHSAIAAMEGDGFHVTEIHMNEHMKLSVLLDMKPTGWWDLRNVAGPVGAASMVILGGITVHQNNKLPDGRFKIRATSNG